MQIAVVLNVSEDFVTKEFEDFQIPQIYLCNELCFFTRDIEQWFRKRQTFIFAEQNRLAGLAKEL